jgi:hypothetical protein
MSSTKKLLAGLGLAGLIAGGAAQAAGPVAAGNQFFISGSTALNNQVYDALLLPPGAPTNGPCVAGSITIYTDAPVVAGGNLTKVKTQANIVCTLANAIGGVAAGTVVAFSKESSGGSNEGTYYEAAQQPLTFFDMTQAPVGCGADAGPIAAGHYWTNQQAIAHEFDGCTGPTIAQIPQIGLADENPQLFNIGLQAITPALIAKINTTPLFQNEFTVAVSMPLYRALQAFEGLVVKDDTLANMPTLTRAQLSSMYSGFIANGSQLDLAAGQLFTCRRGDNSGSNVSADVFFLHNRCDSGGVQHSPPMNAVTSGPVALGGTGSPCAGLPAGQSPENNGCTWTSGAFPAGNLSDIVFGGNATGDVLSCLDAHSRNGDYAFGPVGGTSKFDDPNGATGAAAEAGTNHWRYIAISGNKPSVVSAGNGSYDYFMDNVENVWTGLAGNPLAVAGYLGTQFQSVVALSDILVAQPSALSFPGAVVDPNYVTGGLQDAFVGTPNATPTTLAAMKANPTSAFTLAASGQVDDCQLPQIPNTSEAKEQL